MRKLNYLWRLLMTGLAFSLFSIGGLAITVREASASTTSVGALDIPGDAQGRCVWASTAAEVAAKLAYSTASTMNTNKKFKINENQ